MKHKKILVKMIVIELLFYGQVKSGPVTYGACMGVCFTILTGCTAAGAGATVASAGAAAPTAIVACQIAAATYYKACLAVLAAPSLLLVIKF
jgi:hypothetical protein